MARLLTLLALCCALLLPAPTAWATPAPPDALQVAVKSAPPFAERDANGAWTGTSIELWERVAAELGLDYVYRETTLDDMLEGVAEGRYDLAVAALTVTAAREQSVDFTHPFYTTGLAIAVASESRPHWRGVASAVLSRTFLELIALLALLQLVVGTAVWALERRRNPEQFPPDAGPGVASGFWWATVTMTTVGYGDKAPKSLLGRGLALLWMLASVIIISSVTATIASSLTIERLDARINGPEDLHRFEVGVIAGTTGEAYLREEKIVARSFDDAPAALDALAKGELDALVWDAPLLRSELAARGSGERSLELVPGVFQRQDYAIAVGEGSELRETINRVLPEQVR